MKTANKLILGLSGILAVSVGIGVTATYAWFRISRAAIVNLTDTTVVGDGSSLSIAYYKLSDSGLLPEPDDPVNYKKTTKGFDISGSTNAITDVSGDGVSFYKPNWDPNAALTEEIATSISQVTNTSAKSYYIRFGISFTNTGSSSFDIYFNDGTAVTAVTDTNTDPALRAEQQKKNDQAALTTRVAVWNENHVTCKSIWQPDASQGTTYDKYSYLAPTTDTTKSAYNVSGFQLNSPNESVFHAGNFSHLSSAPAAGSEVPGQKLLTVPSNTTVLSEIGIWTEGTLVNTVNTAQGGHINVSLAFIAL
jgi:hypothetical protein